VQALVTSMDDVVAAASLDGVAQLRSTKPERPEASHAAGPIGLVGDRTPCAGDARSPL
jgi:hypothetical protein